MNIILHQFDIIGILALYQVLSPLFLLLPHFHHPHHIVLTVDGVADLYFLDDEAVFQMDEVVDDEGEVAGKKSNLF